MIVCIVMLMMVVVESCFREKEDMLPDLKGFVFVNFKDYQK